MSWDKGRQAFRCDHCDAIYPCDELTDLEGNPVDTRTDAICDFCWHVKQRMGTLSCASHCESPYHFHEEGN
jgi:hypothetical protein